MYGLTSVTKKTSNLSVVNREDSRIVIITHGDSGGEGLVDIVTAFQV